MEWTLANIVRMHAAERGPQPMITYGARLISYAEMDAASSRVAQALLAERVGPGDRIAFLDKNGPEYFEVLFGGAKINAVNVAVNWRLAPPEMVYTINDAEATLLFVGQDFVSQLDEIEGKLDTVKKIVVLGGHPRHENYATWMSRQPAEDPRGDPSPDDVSMQLYTSGTTGLPKGAMLTNRNLGTIFPHVGEPWGLDATSVNVVAMPLFHIGGSGWALCGMWNGCHSILFREFVPSEVLIALERYRVTNALFVPAMLQFLTSVPGAADRDYASLRSIVYGASPITDEVLIRSLKLFRCRFVQVYGLTETTGAITELPAADHDPEGPRARLLRSAGKPYPWVELRIVDPDTGEDRPTGEVGELWTRSVQNMKGYWKKPEETARVFAPGGWLKTGDAGFMDAEGYVFLTDRVKDMILSGGENIYPAEVENALSGHPEIADVAVIGVPDDTWGERVKAIVVKMPGADPSPSDIIDYARQRLAHYKCPTSVDFMDALPRNPSGKLLKRQLREPYWIGHERRIH
ncbi:MAG: long-chain fatty acid--CoA ligase [Candidatus Rokuibacteriota bacterium]|nr:MAG: long-chain fatty acid--CoA ligase [Candidatus Rokubacteria bacterium]